MSINHQNNGLTTSCNYLPECFWCIITLPGSTPLPMTSGPRNHFLQRKPSCKLASEGRGLRGLRGLPGLRGLWVQSAGSNKLCWRHYSGYWCGVLIMFKYKYTCFNLDKRELRTIGKESRFQEPVPFWGKREASMSRHWEYNQQGTDPTIVGKIHHQSPFRQGMDLQIPAQNQQFPKMSHLKSLNLRCLLPANQEIPPFRVSLLMRGLIFFGCWLNHLDPTLEKMCFSY